MTDRMDMVKTIKGFRGDIVIEVPFDNGSIWVKTYKNDLLTQLKRFADPSEAFEILTQGRATLYISRRIR